MHLLCWQCYSLLKSAHFLSTSLLHDININCLTVAISLCCFCFETHITMPIKSRIFIMASVSFIRIFCVQYWHWLQSHPHSDAHDCEKHIASFNVFVTSVKHACVAATASSSLLSEEVDSSHTSTDFILFSVAATSLIFCSCDSLIVLICLCCLWCSKVIVTLLDHKCEVVKNVQCSQCFKNCKACNSICKMPVKHCVWLMVLLDSDWVQCSSQRIICCCHHHIWKRECRQKAGSAAGKLYQSSQSSLACCRSSWSQKEININDRGKASAA